MFYVKIKNGLPDGVVEPFEDILKNNEINPTEFYENPESFGYKLVNIDRYINIHQYHSYQHFMDKQYILENLQIDEAGNVTAELNKSIN